jgi:hypothetical protein
MYDIPILLVGFNRPEMLEEALKNILVISPRKLYISIDGPRENNLNDLENIAEIKKIIEKNVSNKVILNARFLNKNVGAEINVSRSVTWAFNKEEKLIIFEDDIVVDKVFFTFMKDMLHKYEKKHEIFMISGCNFSDDVMKNDTDIIFSKYGHTYGWAIWKDRWDSFDLNIPINISFSSIVKMKKHFDTWTQTLFHFTKFRNMMLKGAGNSSWDACFSYTMRSKGLLAIVPSKNLSKNIGLYGLHSNGKTYHLRETHPDFQYDIYPNIIKRNIKYDKIHFRNHFRHSYPFRKALKNLLSSIINNI